MVQLDSKSCTDSESRELPLAGQRRERGDAAANRERILSAARRLLAERGPEALTMDAVATAAGVGKGTVFRRFGDRDGLTQALLDEYVRGFQDAFLSGPPPLGPGAPAAERLEAFIAEFVRLQADHLDFAMAAERPAGQALAQAYAPLVIHVASLIREIDPDADEHILAGFILSAISPPVLRRMRDAMGADTCGLQTAARALLRGVTAPAGAVR